MLYKTDLVQGRTAWTFWQLTDFFDTRRVPDRFRNVLLVIATTSLLSVQIILDAPITTYPKIERPNRLVGK